ncbi:MAG TPA: hypothetical protein VMT52_17530 [Planctomycetota bacterium]|nr:hypothetical protein [Planctomycetota bacterium]
MADANTPSTQWGQRLDKIAYGVAGGIGLILLIVALFVGDVTPSLNALEVALVDFSTRQKNQVNPDIKPPPLAESLKSQWQTGAALSHDPRWITEVPPILVKEVAVPVGSPCKHDAGVITKISCERDKEKEAVFLKVEGNIGAGNAYVVLRKMELHRKEGDGDFKLHLSAPKPVNEPGAAFELADWDVEPGKVYTYQLVTMAARDPSAPKYITDFVDPAQATQRSEPLGPTPPVPPDFSLQVLHFDKTPGKFFGKLAYWDYAKDAKVTESVGRIFEEKIDKFSGDRYMFHLVINDTGEVLVRDLKKGTKFPPFTTGMRLVAVEPWPPVTPRGPEPPPGEEPPVDARASGASSKGSAATSRGGAVKAPVKKAAAGKGTSKAAGSSKKDTEKKDKGRKKREFK